MRSAAEQKKFLFGERQAAGIMAKPPLWCRYINQRWWAECLPADDDPRHMEPAELRTSGGKRST